MRKNDYGKKKEDVLEGAISAKIFILKELLEIFRIERAQKINVGNSLKRRKKYDNSEDRKDAQSR